MLAVHAESVTGKGPLGQLGLETGIPLYEAEPFLIASILFTLFAAINEGRGEFTDE
jgi:photosystem II 22kDa protein